MSYNVPRWLRLYNYSKKKNIYSEKKTIKQKKKNLKKKKKKNKFNQNNK